MMHFIRLTWGDAFHKWSLAHLPILKSLTIQFWGMFTGYHFRGKCNSIRWTFTETNFSESEFQWNGSMTVLVSRVRDLGSKSNFIEQDYNPKSVRCLANKEPTRPFKAMAWKALQSKSLRTGTSQAAPKCSPVQTKKSCRVTSHGKSCNGSTQRLRD